MRLYTIISPATERDLDAVLREHPLSGRTVELLVRRQLDELAVRRGDRPEREKVRFAVETIYTQRPVSLVGMVEIDGDTHAARIDSRGAGDDGGPGLLLVVP